MNSSHPDDRDSQQWVRDDSNDEADESQADELTALGPASTQETLRVVGPDQSALRSPEDRALWVKRTMIPILLTLGVLLIGIGAARWVVDEDSVIADLPQWLAITMISLGGMGLMLSAVNMRSIKTSGHGRN